MKTIFHLFADYILTFRDLLPIHSYKSNNKCLFLDGLKGTKDLSHLSKTFLVQKIKDEYL